MNSHFRNEEARAQTGEVACLKSHKGHAQRTLELVFILFLRLVYLWSQSYLLTFLPSMHKGKHTTHTPKLWSHHTNLHFWKTMYSLTPGLLQKHFPRPDTFFPKLLLTWLIPMHPWSLTVAVNTSRKPSLASKCSWVGPFAWLPPPPGPLQLLMPYLGTACSLQTGRPRQWSVISPPSLTHAWLLTLINRF